MVKLVLILHFERCFWVEQFGESIPSEADGPKSTLFNKNYITECQHSFDTKCYQKNTLC